MTNLNKRMKRSRPFGRNNHRNPFRGIAAPSEVPQLERKIEGTRDARATFSRRSEGLEFMDPIYEAKRVVFTN